MSKKPLYRVRAFDCIGCGTHVEKRCPGGTTYCTLTCYRTSKRPSRQTGAEVPCSGCGKTIYRSKSALSLYTDHFCDRSCFLTWWGRTKTEHVCKMCGKTFRWSPSRSLSGKYNITYCTLKCRDADPARRTQLIAMNVGQQTMKESRLERRGYEILDELGITYLRQHLIGGKFCVDAFVPGSSLVVQFDGDYWHGNPVKFPTLDARQDRRRKLDQSQDAYMRACGFTVLRLWESDVYREPDHVRARLRQHVAPQARTPDPLP